MREMKPLILPKLVAARKSSKSSLDMAFDPANSIYSCTDSGFYSVSECSTPPTPGHSARGHFRHPSSTSSLSSSPPNYDIKNYDLNEAPNASGKLPKLTEEPMREDDYVMLDRCSYDESYSSLDQAATEDSTFDSFGSSFDFGPDVLSNDSDFHSAKRRRSGDPPTLSITNKIESRFPSFSRKVRERKRASTFGQSSRSATSSRGPSRAASTKLSSTRTSSMTSSIHQVMEVDASERPPLPSARTSKERVDQLVASSPIDIAKANEYEADAHQEDVERYATTPLLPPMLVKTRFDDQPTQSPLQSPTVADPPHSLIATPTGTPPTHACPTPPLSAKPSVSSMKVATSDIPESLVGPDDGWAGKLSHANFTIEPEPYVPKTCDQASLSQLFTDWEQARYNFTKHLVRTGEHYGVTSTIYRYTEQKWAEIDAVWKANHDRLNSLLAPKGVESEKKKEIEPAPLCKMPSLNDPKSEGKFPKLGDGDIVGPMVRSVKFEGPNNQEKKEPESKKRAFFKFFSDMKFPASFLGRSSTGIRSR